MDAKSRRKVVNAGFVILRCDDSPQPRIKYQSAKTHEWLTWEKFETKAARDREFKKLLEDDYKIMD